MPFRIPLGDLLVRLTGDSTKFEKMIDNAEKRITKASQRLGAAGRKMSLAITAPLAAIATISVKRFADFDDAMTKSTSIMGKMSDTLRKEMEQTALTISKTSVTSAKDLAEAYFFLASAGLDAKASIAALGVVEKFAVAGAFDMATATDLLTDALSAMGLASKDAAKNRENLIQLSDVLIKANTLANASAEQFSKALVTKAAAALRLLNKDVEEGVAVLAAFADQGIKGQQAGEKLSIVLRDLQSATLKNSKEWKKLGLEVFDANGKMLPLADIIGGLSSKFSTMTDKQKKATAQMLGFQDRSFSAIQTLFGTSEKIREYEKQLRKAGGTTEDVANNQLQSFSAQMAILRGNLNAAAIALGKRLAPVVTFVASKVQAALKWWNSISEGTKVWVVRIAALVAAIGPLLLVLAGMASLASAAIAFFTGGLAATLGWVAAVTVLAGSFAILLDAILQLTGTGNLGLIDMINRFRVGGVKIATWMSTAFLLIEQAGLEAGQMVIKAWMIVRDAFIDLGGQILRSTVEMAKGVANAWEAAKDFMTGGLLDNNFKANIEENNKFFNDILNDSLDAAETRNQDFYKAIGEMDDDLRDLQEKNAARIADLFKKDADELAKEAAKVTKEVEIVKETEDPATTLEKQVESTRIKRTASTNSFGEINLRRIALAGPTVGDRKAKKKPGGQEVKAVGVEERLDTLIEVTRDVAAKASLTFLG